MKSALVSILGASVSASLALAIPFAQAGCSKTPDHPAQLGDCNAATSATGCDIQLPAPSLGTTTDTCGGLTSSDATCTTCLTTSCCTQGTTCAGDSQCATLATCTQKCGSDANCVAACRANSPSGTGNYDLLATCEQTSCTTACTSPTATTDAGSCGSLAMVTAACTTCSKASCCSQSAACAASALCPTVLECVQGCAINDQTCVDNCRTLNPTGVAAFDTLNTCLTTSCASACQ